MSDISTLWNTTRGDWTLAGADLASGNDVITGVLISLFTDRVAGVDDVIPDGTADPRGWWGDDETHPVGSRLWLIDRAKKTQATLGLAQSYIQEALQWLIDDGVCSRVDVYVEWSANHTLGAQVTAYPFNLATPIKLQTQNVFEIANVQAWSWNRDLGIGQWVPVPLSSLPIHDLPTYRLREADGDFRLREGGGRRRRETDDG